MPRAWTTFPMLPLIALLPVSALAQDRAASRDGSDEVVQVIGSVVDRTTDEPVPLATVVFTREGDSGEPAWSGVADADGQFETGGLAVGQYSIDVTALSYTQVRHVELFPEEAVVDVRVEMVPVDYALDPIVVVAQRSTRLERAGFYRRERQGIGYFVDHAEIEARNPLLVSDLFRSIPGARVGGTTGSVGVRTSVGLRGGCEPQIVMDGAVLAGPVALDELTRPSDLEAIEVYHGPTAPIAYNTRSTCGTIVMWTRSPPEPTGRQISLMKFFAIIGFATLAVAATN